MRKILKATGLLVVLIVVGVGAYLARGLYVQGLEDDFWKSYTTATVTMDRHGIPTIEGKSWGEVIEAQGFVVAASRLWQMDLIRRKASGRLSEWFGEAAFAHDERMSKEGRIDVVRAAVDRLPPHERTTCDLFAQGVNAFIREHPGRWGAEYFVLRAEPEPWVCADSLLVLLEMSDMLTASADREAKREVWRRHLSPAWENFLFPLDHPWNRPMFGTPPRAAPALPPASEFLKPRPLDDEELGAALSVETSAIVGSNNWAWRGRTGVFLANDPHLGLMVPGIWYAMRLRVSKSEWAVGSALPGIPGVIIGMNPAVAWAFTNTGEDVDDYLAETISEDGKSYLAQSENGRPIWEPITKRTYAVTVKGETKPREVVASFTRRGPLVTVPVLGAGLYSRQWLPLKEGVLRLPVLELMRARSYEAFDRSLDAMTIPSQNVLIADRHGGLGYRMTGTGVIRKVSGQRPQPGPIGEWGGLEESRQRLRLYVSPDKDKDAPQYLATANERVWVDPNGATWAADDRKDRIMQVLSGRDNFVREDMERLHLDTRGRFRKQLLQWVAGHVEAGSDKERALVDAWQAWDGDSRSNSRAFAQSTLVEDRMMAVLTARVSETFPEADRAVPYAWFLDRAWLLVVMEAPGDEGFQPFGLTASEVARYLLEHVVANDAELRPHDESNQFKGHHPFVGQVPILGGLFGVDAPHQWGAHDLVLAESPSFGPSMRMVWDLKDPSRSTWIFPVGQSGHMGSKHYRDMQKSWIAGTTFPVFDDGLEWSFAEGP